MPIKSVKQDTVSQPAVLPVPSQRPAVDEYVPSSGNHGFVVSRYDLDLKYVMSSNKLEGTATLHCHTLENLTQINLDCAPHLQVLRLAVDGRAVKKYRQSGSKLRCSVSQPLAAGAVFTVVVKYRGNPRPISSLWGTVGWEELADGVLVASQPHGATSWFPCNDHPSNKASFRIAITCDSPYKVICSGVLTEKKVSGSTTRWVYEVSEPTCTYLISMVVGQLQHLSFTDSIVPIDAYITAEVKRDFRADFSDQERMMDVFVDKFGPYPYPLYRVIVTEDELEIPLEGCCHSVFGANHCTGTGEHERLVAHELAHQWFGNSLTLSQWKDIWLHEGFACYAEWLWSEWSGKASAASLARVHYNGLVAKPADIIVGDPGRELMFDDRVYKRGALTLHALRCLLGDDSFFTMVKDWATLHAHSTVTTEDFLHHVSSYHQGSVAEVLSSWLDQAELPAFPVGAGEST